MVDHAKSYLSQIHFDPKLEKTFHGKYLKSIRLVILLILIIAVVGITSFLNLPKRLNPEIKIPIVIVSTVLPGAGPQDVESLLTIPLEDKLTGTAGLTDMTSSSQDNVSVITMQFTSTTNSDKALNDVQKAVDSATTLPSDAKAPNVRVLDFEDQPVWTFSLTGKEDLASLQRFSNQLKTKLEEATSIDRVTISGLEEQEIQILLKPEKLQSLGLDAQTVSRAVQTALSSYPAGSVKTGNTNLAFTLDQEANSVNDIRNLNISIGTNSVPLSEVALVMERSKPLQTKTYMASATDTGKRAITFSVYKTKTAGIDETGVAAKKIVDQQLAQYSGQFTLKTEVNTADRISDQFKDLQSEFFSTIMLVFFAMLFFLGLRQALIVALDIPLTFLVTFAIMRVTGLTLNFLSLFSLLLALGLLVDDAIVTVQATTAYYRTGRFTPYQTGLLVWRDFIIPIWTTTICTVWAFIPLLLSTGIIGEFIKTIPIVVSAALYTSTAIAVTITLPLMMLALKPNIPHRVKVLFGILFVGILCAVFFTYAKANPLMPVAFIVFALFLFVTYRVRFALMDRLVTFLNRFVNVSWLKEHTMRIVDNGVIDSEKIGHVYQRLIDRILDSRSARRRVLIVVALFSIFSYLLVPLGFVVNEFFPKSDEDEVFVQIELPQGTSVEVTDREAVRMLDYLRKTNGVDFVVANVGSSAPTGGASGGGGGGSQNTILYTFVLPPKSQRKIGSTTIGRQLREDYIDYSTGKFSVVEVSGGPPAGADVQIKLLGDDLAQLDRYAAKTMEFLKTQPGVTNVDKSIKTGTSKVVFKPDLARLSQNGLTLDSVGFQLRTFASGSTIDTVKFNGKDSTDITFRTSDDTQYVETIGRLEIGTKNGTVPLLSLGSLELKPNPTLITRESGKRTISVSAGVQKGFSVSTVNKKLEDFADSTLALQSGYEWKTGGVNEENQKSVASILQAMLLAVILIFGTMVLQFNSYRKAMIVLLTIPPAISGVFLMFALTGTPLSFPALIGVLALFGIVVNNGMMIIDKITRNQGIGMNLREAISDAAASRVEPIAFTSITTIIGLLPITLSDPLWRGLGGAIVSGLLFSGAIMLFFIPIVYYFVYRNDHTEIAHIEV